MKINFFPIPHFSKVSFKSGPDFCDDFDCIDTDFFSFQQSEKDEFVSSEPFKTSYETNRTEKVKSELISLKKIISEVFLQREYLVHVRKEAELTTKASYIFALRLYSEDDPERNNLIKKYIMTRLEEKYPPPAVKPVDRNIKGAQNKNLQQLEAEKREHLLRCRILFQNHANTLTDLQKDIFTRYCDGHSGRQIAKDLKKHTGAINFSIKSIINKLESLEDKKRREGNLSVRKLIFIKKVLNTFVAPENEEAVLEKFDKAFNTLTLQQRNIIYLRFLDAKHHKAKEIKELMQNEGRLNNIYLTSEVAIIKLWTALNPSSKLSGKDKIALMEKYPKKFNRKELDFMKLKYMTQEKALGYDKLAESLNCSFFTAANFQKNIERKINLLRINASSQEKAKEKSDIVAKYYETGKHLLTPLQRSVIEYKYFTDPPLSLQQIKDINGVPIKTLSWNHAKALKLLAESKL